MSDDETRDEHDDEAPPSSESGGLEPGALLDDKFRVERLLGMGGMGAVYEVTHALTKHRRALKLLHPQFAQQKVVVERFFREASAAGHIGNDHIIETFDAGWLTTGEPYLVMELLEGMPLSDRIEEQPEGMDLDEVLEIIEQLGDGVQAAHEAGIVHRDLKPDNVFLARGKGAWRVKVLDFGVSKFDEKLATKLTSGGSMVGTPAYMSPEQFDRGADVDPPSDVYAMGVILYEMLTGRHPYPADTLAQLMKLILLSEPTPLREHRADLPASVETVVDRMLQVDPEVRLGSPRAAVAALRDAIEETQGISRTTLSDPRELGMQKTVASDIPPAMSSPPSAQLASLAKTQLVDEEDEPPSAVEPEDEMAVPTTPSPWRVVGAAAVAIAVGAIAFGLSEDGPESTPPSATATGGTAAVRSAVPIETAEAPTASATTTTSAPAATASAPPPPSGKLPPPPPPPPPTATATTPPPMGSTIGIDETFNN